MNVTWVLYFLAAFGFAFIVGHSWISLAFREWAALSEKGLWFAKLLECPACLGFWIGLAAVLTGTVSVPFGPRWFAAIVLACATSGSNLLCSKWVGLV